MDLYNSILKDHRQVLQVAPRHHTSAVVLLPISWIALWLNNDIFLTSTKRWMCAKNETHFTDLVVTRSVNRWLENIHPNFRLLCAFGVGVENVVITEDLLKCWTSFFLKGRSLNLRAYIKIVSRFANFLWYRKFRGGTFGHQHEWSPAQMVTTRMVTGTNGHRTNGHRHKWSPHEWSPAQMVTTRMVTGTNGHQHKWSPK